MRKFEKNIEDRKQLVARLKELTGLESRYTFVPRCAYLVGSFTVEKDGSLTHFEVAQSPDERLSAEAIRVLKLTAPWQPAQDRGRIVRSHFNVPITFRLK